MEIPDSILIIDAVTLRSCTNPTNVVIGTGVSNIHEIAFADCRSLLTIDVAEFNTTFSSLEGVLFDKPQNTILLFPEGRSGTYIIPQTVMYIGTLSFGGRSGLTRIEIPDSLLSIGVSSFWKYDGLTGILIPDSVESISAGSFLLSAYLSSVTCGSNVTNIEKYAFQSCPLLESIYFQGNAPYVKEYAFSPSQPKTLYYRPGTMRWAETYAGSPTVIWNPLIQKDDETFVVSTNGFGFNITGLANALVVVKGCTNLTDDAWTPLYTSSMPGGSDTFADEEWPAHPVRYYRLDMP